MDYEISIVGGDSSPLLDFLHDYKGKKLALFSDEHVYSLYESYLRENLKDFDVYYFIFSQGETSKSLTTYKKALEFLSDKAFDRSDLVLGFGGGVTGDLAAFVSSTYQRGLAYIAIPTSLLAMVDSSVGGKTAINLGPLKNQVGTFYFPSLVHIDTDFLKTLDDRNLASGLGEVYKYALLDDESIFYDLDKPQDLDYKNLIRKSLECKIKFVSGDEKDRGKRQALNLGHTLAHAIEALSGHQVLHGEAVAIGLVQMAKLSSYLGLAKEDLVNRLVGSFSKYKLPTELSYRPADLMDFIKHDKKIRSGKIRLILPLGLGSYTEKDLSLEDLSVALTKI